MPEVEWGNINSGEKSNLFVSLKDGESIQGVFRGKAFLYYSVYKDPNEYEEWGEGRSKRYKVNFIVKTKDGWEAKIFNQGIRTFSRIEASVVKYGVDSVFEIKREGTGKEGTEYHVFFEKKLTPKELEDIKSVELKELPRKVKDFIDEVPDSDVPF